MFSTYSTLVSTTHGQKAKGGSRLSQLVGWCGGEAFDGAPCRYSASAKHTTLPPPCARFLRFNGCDGYSAKSQLC